MYNDLLKQIKAYNNITIFRHVRPDGDAVFSSLALKEFIKTNFKDKKVKLAGFETYDLKPVSEKVSDKFIKDSLGIVLDVTDLDRIDDQRVIDCKYKIVIDHHPVEPKIYNTAYIDSNCAAACELLSKILLSKTFKNYKLNSKVCEYLICGILTDSVSFSTTNTTGDTLYYASKLVETGKLNLASLNEYVFAKPLNEYKKVSELRNTLKIKNGVGYCLLDEKALKKINMTYSEAKNNVNEFKSIKELKIWGVFAYNPETKLYDGSVRSHGNYVINTTCVNYNGGGHKNACGVKKLSKKQVENLINDLVKIADK